MSNAAGTPATPKPHSKHEPPSNIYLVSYPKFIFLYPTFLAALAAAVAMLFRERISLEVQHFISLAFLGIFAANLIVLSFDFPRGTSLTLFFFLVALGIGLWSLFKFNPNLLPSVTAVISRMNPEANGTFYFMLVAVMGAIYIGVMIVARFDYWEVRPNELLHHHGFLSNLKRYAAPNLRIEKEITDVFEYFLLGSGRLILHPSSEPRAIVLEHVIGIERKEAAITRMLSALQVRVQTREPEDT